MRIAALAYLLAAVAACRSEKPPLYRQLASAMLIHLDASNPLSGLESHGLDVLVFDSDLLIGGSLDDLFRARDCALHHEHSRGLRIYWPADSVTFPGMPITNALTPADPPPLAPGFRVAVVQLDRTPTRPLLALLEDEGVRPTVVFGSWTDLIHVPRRDAERAWATLRAHPREGVHVFHPDFDQQAWEDPLLPLYPDDPDFKEAIHAYRSLDEPAAAATRRTRELWLRARAFVARSR